MNSTIIYGPKEEFSSPTQSFGKIIYEDLKKVDKDLIAFINSNNTNEFLTFGNVLEFSRNLSINLRNLGLKANDVIGVVAENSIHYFLPILAGFYLGTPVHLINSNYTEYELRHLFKISKPKMVFCSKSSLENIRLIQNESNIEKLIIFDDTQNYSEVIIKLQDLIKKSDGCSDDFELSTDFDPKEHVALILNSSGTTGLPKGVMLTHESLQKILGTRALDLLSYKQPTVGICSVPLCHPYGFYIALGSLLSSSKIILMNKFTTELFFELIQNFQVKKLFLVPTLINLMVTNAKVDLFNLSSLEEICSAASPLNASLAESVAKKFNLKSLYQIYGSAECGLIALSYSKRFDSKFSEGKLLPGKLLKVCNPNTYEPLGVEEFGEICLKGSVFKGYMNDEEKTHQSIDDEGFFHTGDGGYYDEKGQLYLIDRIKDVIKYKSIQFSPVEVEGVLLSHPAVEDAAVVGKPDNHAGELPVAFIVRKPGFRVDENDIKSYVANFFSEQKHLHGGVRFVKEIPRTAVGKIMRNHLKKLL